MTGPKLTKPQIEFLDRLLRAGGEMRETILSPSAKRMATKMRRYGYVILTGSVGVGIGIGVGVWRITQAGRDALEGVGG
ncbi:hypothetical protein NFI95_15430 [Acetobacteraceae bacterium KSS8]|uniref:Uncharacterized protein n=1 Tax=Endosaccharibacter trunci TaxID=2812733 RepID=A0ABT1WAB8_9PROT|nr:hypothetical protein [Acetobacteraceae bacterium KSS8]